MKTQEEIVVKAKAYGESIGNKDGLSAYDYVMGYTQCQEDNKDKKYTEEDMLKLWNTLMVAMTNKNPIFFKDYINSLNKQD